MLELSCGNAEAGVRTTGRYLPSAARAALEKTLNSPLHAVPSVSVCPLLLSLDVDHRKSSVKSSVSAL